MLGAIARAAGQGLPWLGLLAISASAAYGVTVASAGDESTTIAMDRPVTIEPCDATSAELLLYPGSNSWIPAEFTGYCGDAVALAHQDTSPVGVGDATHRGPALVSNVGQTTPLVAPVHFDQVLLTVDFPAGTWTPIHTPGGYVSTRVIDGAISTRTRSTVGVSEATLEAGDTFASTPGVYLQVGNATPNNARVIVAATLPNGAPLTIYQDGYTTNAYPTLTDWNRAHDLGVLVPGPTTGHRASIEWNGIPRPVDDGRRAVDAVTRYGDIPEFALAGRQGRDLPTTR